MGLKSKEINHLLIRQLKQTANEPVTRHVLFMTDGLYLDRLTSFYIYFLIHNVVPPPVSSSSFYG